MKQENVCISSKNKVNGNLSIWECGLLMAAVVAVSLFISASLDNTELIWIFAAFACLIAASAWLRPEGTYAVAKWCFCKRWYIAAIVFIICVLLRISGSSIGIYDELFPTQIAAGDSTLFGAPRWIRSDEWGVQTMKFFSQEFNDYGMFSTRMSISDTNMVLDYYSPVLNVAAVGKPLMWGYLLFGSEIGLSWYWCGMIILIFMTATEMLLILTKGDGFVSAIGGLVVVLSPSIQWWVMPHMPIVIMYDMALFCAGYYFFTKKSKISKWVLSAIMVMTIIGLTLSIFPSFQVPCTYAVLALLAVCLYRDRKSICFSIGDWLMVAASGLLSIGILVYVILISKEGLHLILNTVYPGERSLTTSGNCWRDLFTDLSSLFLPYRDSVYANNCEISSYIHFAPFILITMPSMIAFFRKRKKGEMAAGITLAAALVVFGTFMCIGFPEVLAKITLFKYCNRMKSVYGWAAVLYTFWGIHVLLRYPDILKKWQKIAFPLAYGIVCIFTADEHVMEYFSTPFDLYGLKLNGLLFVAAEIALFTAILILISLGRRGLVCGLICLVMITAGGTVNPVEKGTDAMYNHPVSECIKEIAEEKPDSCWLCTGCLTVVSNYVMAQGVRVLDATNFYPDVEKWEIIDPEGIYSEYTNRYSNQISYLWNESGNKVELVAADSISYTINTETLKALNIEYLLSAIDYSQMLGEQGISCKCILAQDGYGIYQLQY